MPISYPPGVGGRQPISHPQAVPPAYGGRPGTVPVYTQNGQVIYVPQRALIQDPDPDMNPLTNPNAMFDTLLHMGHVFWTRKFRSILIFSGVSLSLIFAYNLFISTVLIAAGRQQPVAFNQMSDRGSATQWGQVLASTVSAPLARTATATLVDWADTNSPQVQFVDYQQPQVVQPGQRPSFGNTPVTPVVYYGSEQR